jgi:hypothetical protein
VAASPDGPRLNLTLGTGTQELAFAGEGPQCRRIVPGAATDSARLELVGGEAIITGWWLERPSGVVVSNLGVPGSQLQFLGRADEATIAAQFQALPADLVVSVSSGTTMASEDDPRPAVGISSDRMRAALTKLG